MLRISRVGLALFLFNLTMVGWELACAHEAQALELPAGSHHGGSPSPHQEPQPEPDEQPCDETASQCCDAIASCTIAGVVGKADSEYGAPLPAAAASTIAERHFANAPLEVATPPPRR